jgi:hypothetical protein
MTQYLKCKELCRMKGGGVKMDSIGSLYCNVFCLSIHVYVSYSLAKKKLLFNSSKCSKKKRTIHIYHRNCKNNQPGQCIYLHKCRTFREGGNKLETK